MLLLILSSQKVKWVSKDSWKGGSSDLSRIDTETWECEHFTTSINHCMISDLICMKLATCTLSVVRKYLIFHSVLQQPQHTGVVRDLQLWCCCNILPYMKKKGCIHNSQMFPIVVVEWERQNTCRVCWWLHPDGAEEVAWLWHPESFVSFQGP